MKRDLILSYLKAADRALTTEELYINIRSNNVDISICTLYKYLSIMASNGEVKEDRALRARKYEIC